MMGPFTGKHEWREVPVSLHTPWNVLTDRYKVMKLKLHGLRVGPL